MRYLSLFSGIEAATVAWKSLGWECVGVSEIEPFPCDVLAYHYPSVPNLGDVTKITKQQIKDLGQIDLVVFGSPCQDLSVAGNRKGFNGERSSLFYSAIRIIQWARKYGKCRFALWENVPGGFSTNKGRDFAAVVEQMAGCRDIAVPLYGWGTEGAAIGDYGMLEWAVLDAQWFGLAQRRKRLFALADFGNWFDRPPILLERNSLRGNTSPSREPKQNVAENFIAGFAESGFADYSESSISGTLRRSGGALGNGSETVVSVVHGTQDPITNQNLAHTLGRNNGQENAIAYGIPGNWIGRKPENGGNATEPPLELSPCLTVADVHAVSSLMQVRRLTPRECERLQGFPDDYTLVPHNKKIATDSPRYKALGNSMAVPVMHWIGQRIQQHLKKEVAA